MDRFFPNIEKIKYEGPKSKNPLAFKYYDENRVINGKTMKEHLRYAVCYWHTFRGLGHDPFGPGTAVRPWLSSDDPMTQAFDTMDAAFEFFTKLGVPFWCFHDRDIAPEGATVEESESNLREVVSYAKKKQDETGMKLLWGTANLFSHPRFMNGGGTNPDFDVFCYAAAQIKNALDATHVLGGENYVFWGGREGYDILFNTDMKRELKHFADLLKLAKAYADEIGFKGQFLIEPKPMEPSTHQYDFDTATVIAFLKEHDIDFVKINMEPNHATLALHTAAHELQVAADAGLLGSIDANRGNFQNGWDTDQFPTNIYDAVEMMLVVLKDGGFETGGLNFDAKPRRASTDLEDMFYGHIGGMDTFARALIIASEMIEGGELSDIVTKRYSSFDDGKGAEFEAGKLSLTDLRDIAASKGSEPAQTSGQRELIEIIFNDYIL